VVTRLPAKLVSAVPVAKPLLHLALIAKAEGDKLVAKGEADAKKNEEQDATCGPQGHMADEWTVRLIKDQMGELFGADDRLQRCMWVKYTVTMDSGETFKADAGMDEWLGV